MFQITVEENFSAGHALRNYRGKCENVHGHNYRVQVTLEGPSLDRAGLLYDFKDLKETIQHAIQKLDHQFLNEVPPFDVLNPSAENLAKYFHEEVSRLLAPNGGGQPDSCRVRLVTVWETETTTASYFADGSVASPPAS